MKKDASSAIRSAEELIGQRKYEEALERLDQIDEALVPESLRVSFLLLASEAALFIRRLESVRTSELLHLVDSQKHGREYGRARFLHGWFLYIQGKLDESQVCYWDSYLVASACDDGDQCAQSLVRLAQCVYAKGNFLSAQDHLEEAVRICMEQGDEYGVQAATSNLATVYIATGRVTKAFNLLQDLEERPGGRVQSIRSKFNHHIRVAIIRSLWGEYDCAHESLRICESLLEQVAGDRVIYYCKLALSFSESGDHRSALRALEKGRRIEVGNEGEHLTELESRRIDCYIDSGKWELAEQYVTTSLELAQKVGHRIHIAESYRALARIALHKGDDNLAREHFDHALSLLRKIGAEYALAVTRYFAATSCLHQPTERESLLFMADRYFTSEKVTRYMALCRHELSQVHSRQTPVDLLDGGLTIVAVDPRMRQIVEFAKRLAPVKDTVLLTGPTGTGKDLLAEYIHSVSGRNGDFVSVNVAAIQDSLIESELFGHAKGSYTGASSNRLGLIAQADKGTLYLNEIGDASPAFQAKLLDVIESGRIRRVGENSTRKVDVRFLAATNRNLRPMMRAGEFRTDLFYRLCEIPIEIPPLDERKTDIPALVEHFVRQHGTANTDRLYRQQLRELGELLARRSYEGNVRELKALVKRLLLLSDGDLARALELAAIGGANGEEERLLDALSETGWNQRAAARLLGVSEATVRKRIKKYGLKLPETES